MPHKDVISHHNKNYPAINLSIEIIHIQILTFFQEIKKIKYVTLNSLSTKINLYYTNNKHFRILT